MLRFLGSVLKFLSQTIKNGYIYQSCLLISRNERVGNSKQISRAEIRQVISFIADSVSVVEHNGKLILKVVSIIVYRKLSVFLSFLIKNYEPTRKNSYFNLNDGRNENYTKTYFVLFDHLNFMSKQLINWMTKYSISFFTSNQAL